MLELLVLCTELYGLNGLRQDATPALQACVARTAPGGVLELPAGSYTLGQTWAIDKNITVRTQGKTEAMPKCDYLGAPDCAELVVRSPTPAHVTLTGGVRVDHVVLNGNKYERLGGKIYTGTQDLNICDGFQLGSGVRLTNSVSKYIACGTSLGVFPDAVDVYVSRNSLVFNGFHHFQWADGLTVPNATRSTFTDNEFIDNTDVQMIFGGCRDCVIQSNVFRHSSQFSGGSFADLMISSMVISGGSYVGTHISGNRIDCGPQRRCGFGLYLGNEAWNTLEQLIAGYNAGYRLGGGAIHDNTIVNAQQGLNLGRTTSTVEAYNNFVSNSGGYFHALCGDRQSSPYNLIAGSLLDRSRDSVPTAAYTNVDWLNCVPNWASPPNGPNDPSEAAVLAEFGAATVTITCPATVEEGSPFTCTATGSGPIVAGYWTIDGVRSSACENQPSCTFGPQAAGSRLIQGVAQTAYRSSASLPVQVQVRPKPAAPRVDLTCSASQIHTYEGISCSITSNVALGTIYWGANGAPYPPCQNKTTCGGAGLPVGPFAIQVLANTSTGPVYSNVVNFSVIP